MINFKRLLIASIAAACITTVSFAQDVTFENKLQWGIVDINIANNNTSADLGKITNKTKAEYSSEKLDVGVGIKFTVSKNGNAIAFGSDDCIEDAYIEFKPIKLIGIGFRRGYSVAGSYLPCLEKEIEAANIGSDFGLFVRPIDGLVIAGGLDFISMFGTSGTPIVNFGAEYTIGETVAFGAAVRNIASNERSVGLYASYIGMEGLTLNAGFTYNGKVNEYNISGNLINAAVMFNKGPWGLYANALFAIGGARDIENELYVAANVCYMFDNGLFASLYGGFSNDFDNADKWGIEAYPGVGYSLNEHNTVGAGVYVYMMKNNTNISFPVYWKYTL